MSSQITQVKPGGEKGGAVGDSTLPMFSDSLLAAAGGPENAVVDGGRIGRRSKGDEDDVKTLVPARDSDATAGFTVLAQVPGPPEMLPVRGAGDGTAASGVEAVRNFDLPTVSTVTAGLPIAWPEGGVATAPVAADPGGSPDTSESESVGTSGADSGGGAVAAGASAEVNEPVVAVQGAAPAPVPVDAETRGVELKLRGESGAAGSSGAVDDPMRGAAVTATAVADTTVSAVAVAVPVMTVDQRTLMVKAGAGSVGGVQAVGPAGLTKAVAGLSVRGKAGIKDGVAVKQPERSTPISTEAADAGSSEGMQSNGSVQAQPSVPVALPTNAIAGAEGHSLAVGSSVPSVATPVDGGRSIRTADDAAPAVVEVAHPVVAIHTAKLLQSVGQTEMRVGLRSTEFGNISIRTSATTESMSAEISVDHGELARMLATHVPEMTARLGGGQPVHVQIEMSGQSAGGSGEHAHGSAQDGQTARQGQGEGSRESNSGGSAWLYEREILPLGLMNDSGSTRLDVRV